ncbi:MAG: hypothetical protein KKB82_06650 [Candidatus Omnitrophica bacterium]|nr:hypothetical protein [Candidatus Omnitrophota bacterium]MBU1925582.1 hypothetical protein [Candidatus Omnitrophota bacterium]
MAKTKTRKIRYKINTKNNKLLVLRDKQKFSPPGHFEIDSKNRLTYLYQRKDTDPVDWNIPRKIVFEGKWAMDSRSNVLFTLRESADAPASQKVFLKGKICDVEANSLAVLVDTEQEDGTSRIHRLNLDGTWRADENNRLNFLVQKSKSRYDTLTFEGGWQVENNEIVYRVKNVSLKRGERAERKLTFKGFWEISDTRRITYVLDRESGSLFNFKLYSGSPNLIAKKGVLKYRLGIAAAKTGKRKVKEITLFGSWKFGHQGGLGFEMDNKKALTINTALPVYKQGKIIFQIKGRKGQRPLRSVVFERGFLKDNASLRLELSEDRKIYTGMKLRW